MILSILICSVQKRLSRFALLARHLEQQAKGKPVEILWLGDNKTMTVGEKRNKLLGLARGSYVAFVDDDDWITDDYIDEILKAAAHGKDCICFNALFCPDKGEQLDVIFSLNNILNVNPPGGKPRLRVPNHLMPVKREMALAIGFLEKNFGEDTDYGLRLRRVLKTEYKIEKALYYYRFSETGSETHCYSPLYKRPAAAATQPVVIDVVMVSNATLTHPSPKEEGVTSPQSLPLREEQEGLIGLTQNAINSVAADNVNIVVLEKAERVKYACADTFRQKEPFNYNQCLNNGAAMGNAAYICFTNNDVLFPAGFVQNVVSAMQEQELDAASVKNQYGHMHADNISGFCFVMQRDAYNKLGSLSEEYSFWCADNVTWEQIKQHKLKHGWLDIKVQHLTSATLKTLPPATQHDYTYSCVKKFNRDYDKNILNAGK